MDIDVSPTISSTIDVRQELYESVKKWLKKISSAKIASNIMSRGPIFREKNAKSTIIAYHTTPSTKNGA